MVDLRSIAGLVGPVAVAVLLVVTAGRTDAQVYLDQTNSIAFASTSPNPSAPYLASLTTDEDPTWVTGFLEHPTQISGSQLVEADSTAWFRDPFDDTDPFDLIPVPFTAHADGSVDYLVSRGRLRAHVQAIATLFPSSYLAVAPDQRPPILITAPFLAGSFAGIQMMYRDEVTFSSSTLSPGAPIEIEVTVHHSAILSNLPGIGGGPPYPNHALSESRLKLLTFDAAWNSTNLGGDPLALQRSEIINGDWIQDDPVESVFTFDVSVGDHFYVEHLLRVYARATADAGNSSAAASADSSNTAGISIRSLTSGVAIDSLSGTDYTIPVPEPGIGLSGSLAIAVLALLRRRSGPSGRSVSTREGVAAPIRARRRSGIRPEPPRR